MALYLAKIEILIEIPDEQDSDGMVCNAIAESMRPLLKEYGGDSFLDWRYAKEMNRLGSNVAYPKIHDGKGFECFSVHRYLERQAASVRRGQKVRCNGHDGTITKVCDGTLMGMVEVRVPGEEVCVGISELNKD